MGKKCFCEKKIFVKAIVAPYDQIYEAWTLDVVATKYEM